MTLLTTQEINAARFYFANRCKGARSGPEVELRLTRKVVVADG